MVEEPSGLGAGRALGLFLLEVLGDLVDQRLEAGTIRSHLAGGGALGIREGGGIGSGGVGGDRAGQGVVSPHGRLSSPGGQRSAKDVAGDGSRGADAARIEADDVEGGVDIR